MKYNHINSACGVVETSDLKIIFDPWVTQGAYYGSWFTMPSIQSQDIPDDIDLIIITHIHPDHYDPDFLADYLKRNTKPKVVIASRENPNYLSYAMIRDGISHEVTNQISINNTHIDIIPYSTGSISDIDSAVCIIEKMANEEIVLLNLNDLEFDENFLTLLKKRYKNIDLLLCGYCGAGPYPQCFYDQDDTFLEKEVENKKKSFLNKFYMTNKILAPKAISPIAGQYILGSTLVGLNQYRGIADSTEVKGMNPNAIILKDFQGTYNLKSRIANFQKLLPFSELEIKERINEIKDCSLDWNNFNKNELFSFFDEKTLWRLISKAFKKAISKSECNEDYFISIKTSKIIFSFNCNREKQDFFKFNQLEQQFDAKGMIIEIDHTCFIGILIGKYNWNNIEVGSLFRCRRTPNDFYYREAYEMMNYFSV